MEPQKVVVFLRERILGAGQFLEQCTASRLYAGYRPENPKESRLFVEVCNRDELDFAEELAECDTATATAECLIGINHDSARCPLGESRRPL